MIAKSTFVRVNGRGNAWPVFLGGDSEFYDKNSSEDLSNASFSILQGKGQEFNYLSIEWEVLIDVGHHTVPFLIRNGNRIPDAVVLTHGHMDHTLGLDWVAQSRYYLSDKTQNLTVYANSLVWESVIQSYPHLKSIINYVELLPGLECKIKEARDLSVTAFPVFHGMHARGASMLLFEAEASKSVVFTGDMLTPLLRKKDYKKIKSANAIYIDSNNRYPYPKSNHASIVNGKMGERSLLLQNWMEEISLEYLLAPHNFRSKNKVYQDYFKEFSQDCSSPKFLPYCVMDFAALNTIKNQFLVHYGGMEDVKYNSSKELSLQELKEWVLEEASKLNLSNINFDIPTVGHIHRL